MDNRIVDADAVKVPSTVDSVYPDIAGGKRAITGALSVTLIVRLFVASPSMFFADTVSE